MAAGEARRGAGISSDGRHGLREGFREQSATHEIRASLDALASGLPKILLTPEQAAQALGIGRTKLYELLGTAELPSVRIGGSRRVSVDALTEFVRRLTPTPGCERVR
jgi:excisionase family DNA binding protein